MDDILAAIPQRPPFLFVDRIVSREGNTIVAERTLRKDEFYFEGHFPGNPIMPGVLLCEVCFQTGGILMGANKQPGLGVVTRIKDAKNRDEAIRALHFAWYYDILPLLQEYFYDSPEKLSDIVRRKFITLDQNRRTFSFNGMLNGEEFLSAIREITNTPVSPTSDTLDE